MHNQEFKAHLVHSSEHRRFGRWASMIDRELTPTEREVLEAITNPDFADYARRQDQHGRICAEMGWDA